MHLSAFKTALHTSSDTCGGVRKWKFCNHNDIWKPTTTPSGLSGLCSCVYDSLTLTTFSFFFFSLFWSRKTHYPIKKFMLSSYFLKLFDLVIVICFCCMNFILILFINFKFLFDFTTIEIVIFWKKKIVLIVKSTLNYNHYHNLKYIIYFISFIFILNSIFELGSKFLTFSIQIYF